MEHSNLIVASKTFWEKAYRQNINKLIGVGYRYTTDREIAEDLAHDAFLLAYEKVAEFEGKGPFEAWLRRIMVNQCLQYLRDQQKQKYITDFLQHEMENTEESTYEEKQDFSEAELLAVINQLPEHHKMVFNLYVIDGFSHAQIAKELGISEGTSKSHLARARKRIKELLNQKKKKSAVFLLFWNIDELCKKRLEYFEISASKSISFDLFTNSSVSAPLVNPKLPFLYTYLSAAVPILSIGVASLVFWANFEQNDSMIESQKNKISEDTATISENRINSQNDSLTINADSMKSLKSIGLVAATVASLGVNSNAQTKITTNSTAKMETIVDKPQTVVLDRPFDVNTDKQQTVIFDKPAETHIDKLQKTVLDNPINTNVSGTFYGERLNWSAENNELYFEGKSIIKFGKNNTITNGRINFLGKVYYLVIDGKPAKLGDKINLTNKKYSLRSLSAQTALAKYGDSGKNGAIEIDIAE
ncbi:RNA polymerase sigma factor [Runella sp. SP2]|uniref:RNA polymerase sigma factor n=1 Tax=Runella sp. SP2 TaxID=2268026 RepID=UPI000F092E4B|nr:RNA polymerase sigma factor [Runella sp. SP2]AYQ31912.1 RNA polymerase sigma factor [Runella sp. SP2]